MRLWGFQKPEFIKNTTRLKANAFGFYALNGRSVVDFKEHSKKEDVIEFLYKIRINNPDKEIILIWIILDLISGNGVHYSSGLLSGVKSPFIPMASS